MEFWEYSGYETQQLLASGEASASEVTEAILGRLVSLEPQINSYVTVTCETAMETARAVDEARAAGEEVPPLAGVPIAVKDLMCTKGVRTTCSSKMLENFVPPYDAEVVARIKAQRMPITGKTNLDEFAMGSSTENSAFFPTHNPWNLDCVPGGSSGGAAATVAARQVALSLGSDTGGSIRQPASFCGVVGLKPTYGRVSRFGLIAFASSLDQIGPLTRDVRDSALALNLIAGHDAKDSTSADVPTENWLECLDRPLKGRKLGLIKEFMGEGIEPEIRRLVLDAVELYTELGAEVEEVSFPHAEYALATYYIIAPAEASSNLARYDGVQYGYRAEVVGKDYIELFKTTRGEGFGPEVKRRIMIGTYALSAGYYDAFYGKAQQVRTLLARDFDTLFGKYDALLSPTSPTVAFKFGERAADPLKMYMSDICTIPVNMAGLPGISLPCGFSEGLPVGLQLITKAWDEASLLNLAWAYEQSTDWHKQSPAL